MPFTNPKAKGYHKRQQGRKTKKRPPLFIPTRSNFMILIEDLKMSIYESGTRYQANQFITTTKVITSYTVRTCTDPQYIRIAIEKLDDVILRIH